MNRFLTRPAWIICAVAFILVIPGSLIAQKRRPIPTPPSKTPSTDAEGSTTNLRTAEQATVEMQILMSRRGSIEGLERERNRLAAQFAQDLERLRRLNSEHIAPLSSNKSRDYKNLTTISSEVRNRAIRIKYYSPLELTDRTGEKVRVEADPNQLETMLVQLNRAITSFLGSPVFRVSAPNDAELRSRAGHDLESVIKLSDVINKISKRLSKS
jgi:hypothetical protein